MSFSLAQRSVKIPVPRTEAEGEPLYNGTCSKTGDGAEPTKSTPCLGSRSATQRARCTNASRSSYWRGEHGLRVTHTPGESYPRAKLGQIAKALHLQLQPGRAQCPPRSDRLPSALADSAAAATFGGLRSTPGVI